MKKKPILLLASIGLCQAAGIIGSFFTISAIPTWYATLSKPSFAPPNWLFGPVWTTLYTLMGISLFLIWRKGFKKKQIKRAVSIFLFHLILNALWSIIFFGLKNPGLAFIEIIAMVGTLILVMGNFWKIDKRATYLLVPYLLWISFASLLNFQIWWLN